MTPQQIEAMKLALDALKLNNKEWKSLADSGDAGYWKAEDQDHYKQTEEAITALEEALAEHAMQEVQRLGQEIEQAPVAWVSEDVCEGQYIDGRPRKIWWECKKGVGTAFYTSPPQRTWVGLIDEDIGDEYVRFEVPKGGFNRFEYAVRAIEAKLKQKNGYAEEKNT